MKDVINGVVTGAVGALGIPRPGVEWSERLTSCIGKAYIGENRIRLSSPIVRRMIRDKGESYAKNQVKETMIHELGHLAHPRDNHSTAWANTVRQLGGSPDRYHHETCRADLYSTREKRRIYPVGQWVEYIVDGAWYEGRILRHNTKTLSVSVGDTKRYWRIPWGTVDNHIQ